MGSSGQFEHLTRQVDDPLCPRRILVRLLALDPLDPHGHVEYAPCLALRKLVDNRESLQCLLSVAELQI